MLRARRASGIVSIAALLFACSGKSTSNADNGGAEPSESGSGGEGHRAGASIGGSIGSHGGEAETGDTAGGGSSAGGSTAAGGTLASGGTHFAGAGRAGGRGRGGAGGGGSSGNQMLGAECTNNADCGTGLICITASSTLLGDGGPSNGMCTMACTPGGTECSALKVGAECANFSLTSTPQGYCLDACEPGAPVDLSSKCWGRLDFMCVDLGSTQSAPFCVPHCRSDAECGSGLYCDKSSVLGLCTKTKPVGDPAGTACAPDAATNTCTGVCIPTSPVGTSPMTGVCGELCAVGSECLYGSGANPAPGGLCAGILSDDSGLLDLGYCLSNCSCSSDCSTLPGTLCRKWSATETEFANALGAPGLCYQSAVDSVELSCGSGGKGSGGAGGSGGAAPHAGAGGSGGSH
ncbi:MAG TPA: hypothetical protein VER96_29315 [Polyangiaceae bacterium]|nr:hypothetical protein [Polyangiaceae bacterium]